LACCWSNGARFPASRPTKQPQYNGAMAKRFQFRLLTLFAVIALVGWGMVAIPHWIKVYPEQRRIQQRLEYEANRPRNPRERALQRLNEAKHPKPKEVDVIPFVMVAASIVALLAALFVVMWLNNRPRSVPKN
jgi:hypothetical protein